MGRSELHARNAAIAAKVATSACTLEAIGAEFGGLSRERVRQIAAKNGVRRSGDGAAVRDYSDRVATCFICGRSYNTYARPQAKTCSHECAVKARTLHHAEHYWDAWGAWLRTGNMAKAGQISGMPPIMISRWLQRQGYAPGQGNRIRCGYRFKKVQS